MCVLSSIYLASSLLSNLLLFLFLLFSFSYSISSSLSFVFLILLIILLKQMQKNQKQVKKNVKCIHEILFVTQMMGVGGVGKNIDEQISE